MNKLISFIQKVLRGWVWRKTIAPKGHHLSSFTDSNQNPFRSLVTCSAHCNARDNGAAQVAHFGVILPQK